MELVPESLCVGSVRKEMTSCGLLANIKAFLITCKGFSLAQAAILVFKLRETPAPLSTGIHDSLKFEAEYQPTVHITHARRKLNLKSTNSCPSAMIVDDVISLAGEYSITSCQIA